MHNAELTEETEKEIENKKKFLKKIKKNINRNRDFRHVAQNAGKGKRSWLKSVQDEDRMVDYNKDIIEHKLIQCNKKYFSKAKESKVCEDKNHENLNNDSIRDKILSSNLNREDFDEDNVHKFLCLLKRRVTT